MSTENKETKVPAPATEETTDEAGAADGDDHVPEEENTAHFEPVVCPKHRTRISRLVYDFSYYFFFNARYTWRKSM